MPKPTQFSNVKYPNAQAIISKDTQKVKVVFNDHQHKTILLDFNNRAIKQLHDKLRLFGTQEHIELAADAQYTTINPQNGEFKSATGKTEIAPLFALDAKGTQKSTLTTNPHKLKFAYSDIIGLAGDYYALVPNDEAETIAKLNDDNGQINAGKNDKDRQTLFNAAADNLFRDASPTEVSRILQIMRTRYATSDNLNTYIQLALLIEAKPHYLAILENNLDHFAPFALQAFSAGQALAEQYAKQAYKLRNDGKYAQASHAMQYANQVFTFACHYLTDMFAAGHAAEVGETYRAFKQQFGATIGLGILNFYHNDRNKRGSVAQITDSNGNKQTILIKGDGHLNDTDDAANRRQAKAVIQLGLNNLAHIAREGTALQNKVAITDMIPKTLPAGEYQIAGKRVLQPAPMFKAINDKIHYRFPFKEENPQLITYVPLTQTGATEFAADFRIYTPQFKYSGIEDVQRTFINVKKDLEKQQKSWLKHFVRQHVYRAKIDEQTQIQFVEQVIKALSTPQEITAVHTQTEVNIPATIRNIVNEQFKGKTQEWHQMFDGRVNSPIRKAFQRYNINYEPIAILLDELNLIKNQASQQRNSFWHNPLGYNNRQYAALMAAVAQLTGELKNLETTQQQAPVSFADIHHCLTKCLLEQVEQQQSGTPPLFKWQDALTRGIWSNPLKAIFEQYDVYPDRVLAQAKALSQQPTPTISAKA
ncbi:MAG: hypothetical protein Tsb005_00310 [Gammaproteobacteria bacterium]